MPRKKRCPSPFELMDDDFDDTSSQSSRNGNPPIQRNAANARERARMRVLSSAFGRLKTKLPNIPADTKLSKLDTLRLATMYIKQLKSVVEGGTASPIANCESTEGSFDQGINQTSCYLNLNVGAHGMNWPFGFHHFSNSPLIRSSSAMSLINNNSSSNNWCSRDNAADEQIKHVIDDTENYEHHHHHQHHPHHHLHQKQTSLFMNDSNIISQQNSHLQHNNWYSEPSSPELDTATSRCLTFEASYFQHQAERHRSQNQLDNLSHQQYHNVSHIQPQSSHSSTFQFRSDFQNHHIHQHEPSAAHHLHQNTFVNSPNFQSTSIR